MLSLKILKIVGLIPRTFKNGKPVTKFSDVWFLIVSIALGLMLIFLSMKYRSHLKSPGSDLIDSGSFATFVASVCIAVVSMICSWVNRYKFWNIILLLSSIDESFQTIGMEKKVSKAVKFIFGIISFVAILSLLLTYSAYLVQKSLLKAALYLYSGFYFLMGVGLVIGLISAALTREKYVTEILKSILSQSSMVKSEENQQNKSARIKVLLQICDKLKKVHGLINLVCGFQTILCYGLLFYYTNFTIFMAFQEWKKGPISLFSLNSLTFAAFFDIFLFSLLCVCSLAERQAQRTLIVSNAIIRASTDETIVAMLLCLNDFIRQNQPVLSCGLFVVDWKFLYTARLFSYKMLQLTLKIISNSIDHRVKFKPLCYSVAIRGLELKDKHEDKRAKITALPRHLLYLLIIKLPVLKNDATHFICMVKRKGSALHTYFAVFNLFRLHATANRNEIIVKLNKSLTKVK